MLLHFFKRNSILLVFLPLYLLVVALALLELDKQYYQQSKKELVTENDRYLQISKETQEKLSAAAQNALLAPNSPSALQQLNAEIRQIIFDDGNPFYRIVLRDSTRTSSTAEEGGERSQENPEKLKERNQLANSLFLQNFSGFQKVTIAGYDGKLIGRLRAYYTNPDPGDQAVHELTLRYRWYSAFLVLVLTLLAATLAGTVLLPLNKVLNSLDASTPTRTVFCRNPRARLESLYNRMALGAVVSRLQARLREEIARNPQLTGWEVVVFTVRAFREQTDLPFVAALELVARGPGNVQATGRHTLAFSPSLADLQIPADIAQSLDAALPRDGRTEAALNLDLADEAYDGKILLLMDPDRTGFRYLFAVAQPAATDDRAAQIQDAMLRALVELADVGLQSLSQRNQLVVKERGRANISLSRNLGHDLTNIIATSKLELMALDRVLSRGELPQDERRRGILRESLQGLLKSIRFMQETVNLYRSYAFLQHPVLEIQDGNTLLAETLDLFALSVSAKIELRRELAEDAPRCVVDPRLIKLALFNMFSNSLKAIRKASPDHASGWLKTISRKSVAGGLCIAIEDSGTGIIDAAGMKMDTHEIEKIFELGYSSRENQDEAGEGLGLNWVRTIVQDLHGGSIHAENTEDHGARFVIVFPPIEQAPDMENAERKAAEYLKQFQRQRAATEEAAEEALPPSP